MTLKVWEQLELDRFWSERLPISRKRTRWDQVLLVLVAYRLLSPGSEWRLHRQWFDQSALIDLLGADAGLAEIHKLYACHDKLLEHKTALFDHLVARWRDLFNVDFDVLLYDLTSTYFEANPPFGERDKRRFGYSRDKRPDCVQVKLLPQDGELYVFAQSTDRVAKERAMRRRQLKRLWARLKQLSGMTLTHQELLMKLGAARSQYPTGWRLVDVHVEQQNPHFTYRLKRDKLKQIRRREGRYLLRTNLTGCDPAELWRYCLQLTQIEEAFRNLKGDLAIRPIYHQLESRIEAHIFIAFLAYCLHVTLAQQLHPHAPGLTPRSVLEKFSAVQMIDVEIPTTDNRILQLTRYTEPPRELKLLLERLRLDLPVQPPPKITATQVEDATPL